MKILEDCVVDGHVLHRIQADRDIPYHGVKVGDVGGWVENPNNLRDDAWVTGYLYGDAVACGNALIEGKVFGNAYIQKSAKIGPFAKVFDNANIGGDAMICDHAVVYGDAHVSDHARVMGYAGVSGNARVYNSARISDFVHVTGRAYIGGDVRLKDKVIVEGDVTICNHAIIRGNVIVKGYGYICNYIHLHGDLVINGEDPDFRLAFPYSISGKCEIGKNEDIIFVATGEMSYVYIKPLKQGFGNSAVLQKVKELCIG